VYQAKRPNTALLAYDKGLTSIFLIILCSLGDENNLHVPFYIQCSTLVS
jgi:hypothetical protein